MKKSLIVAMTPSGVIGKNGGLPWPRLAGDLPRFRRLTMGKPCIMGRKTFDGLSKALDGRMNIIVSRKGFAAPGVNVASSVLEAWIRADESGNDEAFVIGGGEVYKQALPSCDRLYLTVLDREFEGDTYFNICDLADWVIVEREYVEGPIPYQNLILERGKQIMAQFITFERLPNNQLPVPRYGTPHSAGIDFAACLSRPCKIVEPGTGNKKDFWAGLEITINKDGVDGKIHERLDTKPDHHDDQLTLLLKAEETILVPLGWKCAFDVSCVMEMYVRSSIGLKGIVLANGTGIIDPDYRGELFAALYNRTNRPIIIKHGERIVQGVLTHFSQGIVREGKVDETLRGEGGLGSTGQMVDNIAALKQVLVADLQSESNSAKVEDEVEPNGPDVHYG